MCTWLASAATTSITGAPLTEAEPMWFEPMRPQRSTITLQSDSLYSNNGNTVQWKSLAEFYVSNLGT